MGQKSFWSQCRRWTLVMATMAAPLVSCLHHAEVAAGEAPASSGAPRQAAWAPKLYAFDMEASDAQQRSLAEEAQMLRELGFDGVAYLLWFDKPNSRLRQLGEDLDNNLRILDQIGLPLLGVGLTANVDPNAPHPYDPRLVEAMGKLKGRSLTVEVLLGGLPPGDERGTKPAITILRQLGDLATESRLRISVYHHTNSWAESFVHALRIAKQVDHPNVGVNFNLAHWLMVDGDKDLRAHLLGDVEKIFVVTINGAKAWIEGS